MMEPIAVGQCYAPRDPKAARYYERAHGGPLRLRVQSVASQSPWAVVVLSTCTGSVPTGRRRTMSALELREGFEIVGEEPRTMQLRPGRPELPIVEDE